MSAAVLTSYGDFSRNYPALKKLGLPASARDVFRLIALFADSAGKAFISGSAFMERLGYRKETISRDLRKLAEKGVIAKLSKKHLGIFPVVEILPCPITVSHPNAPMTARSSTNDQMIIAQCANDQTEQRRTYEIEKQPEKIVCSKILEKNHLKESLKSFGIGSNKAMRLIAEFPLERINGQIINLKAEQARGAAIENPAGWLIKAIQKNFCPAIERRASNNQDEIKAEKSRAAQRLLQEAIHAERIGQMDESKRMAQRSLEIHQTCDAKELLSRIDAAAMKKDQQEKAIAAMPKEEFERILLEETTKQNTIFMRLGITKMNSFHEQAAFAAAVERAIGELAAPACEGKF